LNKKNRYEDYPFSIACLNNNIKLAKLLIDYAMKNNIILELNEKNKYGDYLFSSACFKKKY